MLPTSPSDSNRLKPTRAGDFESVDPPMPASDSAVGAANLEATTPVPPPPKPGGPPAPDPNGRRPGPPGEARAEAAHWKPTTTGPLTIPGYELVATIGRGAMGVVYRARQTSLNRTVALKVMLAGAHASDEDRARFRTEALAVAQVQHPNVIQVYDVGEHEGIPYLAVEYAAGGNLQQWLDSKPMSVPGAVRLMYSVARAVAAAHARGVVHRDLKPANILLTADGVPKVADFGLAKQAGATNYTATGSLIGTPAYMSPEQAGGLTRRVGPASDVWALGVILYQCLAGRVPFACESVLQLLDQIRFAEPVPVREWRREVPEEVEAVLRRCLHKAPEERYRSAEALADDLAQIVTRWEAERAQGEDAVEAPGHDYSRVIGIIGLVATALLALFVGREAGWFARPSETTAPATAPAPVAEQNHQITTP